MTALYDGYGNLILAKTPPQPDLALVAEMLREPERFTEGAREEQALLCEQADNAEAARIGTVQREPVSEPYKSAASEDGLPELPHPDHAQVATFEGTPYVLISPEDYEAIYLRLAASGQGVDSVAVAKAIHEGLRRNGTTVLYSGAFERIVAQAIAAAPTQEKA